MSDARQEDGSRLAIDFGTSNTVPAIWRDALQAAETLRLNGLSAPAIDGQPPVVPSLVYVENGQVQEYVVGQQVRDRGLDGNSGDRLFRSFKRGIVASPRPRPVEIDGVSHPPERVATAFLAYVIGAAQEQEGPIEELALTVPVNAFERYLKWLQDGVVEALSQSVNRIRIVDESTAAALGYEVREPEELVLVLDFGGGTLDLSLVKMPRSTEEALVDASSDSRRNYERRGDAEARVIAKAGALLGGEDIDAWLLDELLVRSDLTRSDIGANYQMLRLAVEAAKIRLSAHETADVGVFDPDTGHTFSGNFTRSQFEALLDQHEFYAQIQRTLDKTLRSARQKGIYPEDIGAVLMVGGSSLIPSVQRMVQTLFGRERVHEHLPFEAVAHGAVRLLMGVGAIADVLYHSYGIRHLSPITNRHEYEEIIAAGTRYPLEEAVELVLTASRQGQEAIELVVGEVEEGASSITEVMFGDHAILMVADGIELRRVVALNDEDGARTVALLDPPGVPGVDRVKVSFSVDPNRGLRATVTDLATDKVLLREVKVVDLR